MEKKRSRLQVRCPDCGYSMPVFYDKTANCSSVYLACKGRKCNKIFEVKIENGQQIK